MSRSSEVAAVVPANLPSKSDFLAVIPNSSANLSIFSADMFATSPSLVTLSLAILYATMLPTITATIAKIATTNSPTVTPKAAAAATRAVPIAAKILPITGNDFASSAMFFPKAAIPAFPLAPPIQPPLATPPFLPPGKSTPTACPSFKP